MENLKMCPASLLVKNSYFIQLVLNRNIGDVHYRREFVRDFLGANIEKGQVIKTGDVHHPVEFNLTPLRRKYYDYSKYAVAYLNDTIANQLYSKENPFKKKTTIFNIFKDEHIQNKGKVLNFNSNMILADTSAANSYDKHLSEVGGQTVRKYDTLSDESEQYISFVLKKNSETEESGKYERSENYEYYEWPHQLTPGYTYLSMYLNESHPTISILNNGQTQAAKNAKIHHQMGNFLFMGSKLENGTTDDFYNLYVANFGNNAVAEVQKRFSEIDQSYGMLLQNVKQPRTLSFNHMGKHIDRVVGYDNLSDTFNKNITSSALYTYAESRTRNKYEINVTNSRNELPSHSINGFDIDSFGTSTVNVQDLLNFTNRNFQYGKYKTMVARFGSQAQNVNAKDKIEDYSEYNTAISERGISHGRNLLKKSGARETTHGGGLSYNDPYCRVWTNYHQYSNVYNLIRPFTTGSEDGHFTPVTDKEMWSVYGMHKVRNRAIEGFEDGQSRLGSLGVLQNNGFVKITPQVQDKSEDVKKCMFSIENLAWKGFTQSLSKEQVGPLGGRIMWFPPYNLKFSENINTEWNQNQFIGRGERVYTYTNTDRTGQLSFTIAVDHPSIINFVKKTNQKDDDHHQTGVEYDLLRFFAGCGVPSVGNISKVKPPEPPKQAPPKKVVKKTEKIICMVFFPNNYTGMYENGTVNPLVYLMNGVGTQKCLSGGSTTDIPTDENTYYYENSFGSATNKELIGYEINANMSHGVTPQDVVAQGNTPVSGTSFNGYTLVPQKNSQYSPTYDWWYRVDVRKNATRNKKDENKAVDCEKLSNVAGHKDLRSFGLNSSKGIHYFKESDLYPDPVAVHDYGLTKEECENNLYAFTEIYVAFTERFKSSTKLTNKLVEYCDEGRLTQLREMLKDAKFDKLKVYGYASDHGYVPSNKKLGLDRARVIENWFINDLKVSFENNSEAVQADILRTSATSGGKKDESEFLAKSGRCAKVVIEIPIETEEDFQDTVNVDSAPSGDNGSPTSFKLLNNQVYNFGNVDMTTFQPLTINVQAERKTVVKNQSALANYELTRMRYPDGTLMAPNVSVEPKDTNLMNFDPNIMMNNNMAIASTIITTSDNNTLSDEDRYDNEYRFFEYLDVNSSFFHHKIREKIRFFDPAYHSITPEGFNARLTFLNQCTRQGPTIGNSNIDDKNRIANNLAFGRQPVCVLRIGDFYYTKIIIESMNIEYENNGIHWDLNPEGIGVQPMYANVNITFKFLGGSDLAGPIGRLQNAVSFNYYANTGVYDNRAEMISYDENGVYNKYREFNPLNNTSISK